MRVLITGAAGFIGYHVAKRLLDENNDVFCVDNINDYYDCSLKLKRKQILTNLGAKFFIEDINNFSKKELKIDLVIHLSAQAGVRLPESENQRYIHSNINGFKSILKFVSFNSVKYFLYASSSSVYANSKPPFKESIVLKKPDSFYAVTKLNNEKVARIFAQENKVKCIGLRFFTVYGPWGRPDMAYFSFTEKIHRGEKIIIFNNGNTWRDMTYIDDVVQGIISSMNYIKLSTEYHEIFNLGNNKSVKTSSLVQLIEKHLKKQAKIEYIEKEKEVQRTCADLNKSQKKLHYSPTTEIEEGYSNFFNWYQEHYRL